MAQYHYDSQIRRFLLQFAKIFSSWNVTKGKDPNGNPILLRVPIMYGDSSRQAATIIANNTANNLPSAPLITYYISGLEYDQKRTQDPTFVDRMHVRQRTYNQVAQSYENTQQQAFTIERLMPVPYTLRITVDFWTTSYQQKLELIEQLGTLFNPSMEIQSTDNFIDWTSLSVVYQDGLTFSSKSVPVGTNNSVDVLSWRFYMPIWISAAAKLKKLGVVEKIIASIFKKDILTDIQDDDLLLGTRQKITPYGYKVMLLGNRLQLLPNNETRILSNADLSRPEPVDTSLYWSSYLNVYGAIRPGISQIWLQNPYMDTEIVGTITLNPLDDRLLIYNIDQSTLPQNTLKPVDAVINPLAVGPGAGLPVPIANRRYLIIEDIGQNNNSTLGWGDLIAKANDVIEYSSTASKWQISFDSQSSDKIEYITNLTTSIQYRFTENSWIKSFEGWYDEGSYSIVI